MARQCLYYSATKLSYSDALTWCSDVGSVVWSPLTQSAVDDIALIYASENIDKLQLGFTLNRGSSAAIYPNGEEADCDLCDTLSWTTMPVTINTGCIIVSQDPSSSSPVISLQTCTNNHTFICSKDDGKFAVDPWANNFKKHLRQYFYCFYCSISIN